MEGHVCIYLNDILIFTDTLEEHCRILQMVLECLWLHKLCLRPKKCEFERTRIEYLGLIVLHGKVEMDTVKVSGVMDWSTPTNQKEVQAFLGFANFSVNSLKDFHTMQDPCLSSQRRTQNGPVAIVSNGLLMG